MLMCEYLSPLKDFFRCQIAVSVFAGQKRHFARGCLWRDIFSFKDLEDGVFGIGVGTLASSGVNAYGDESRWLGKFPLRLACQGFLHEINPDGEGCTGAELVLAQGLWLIETNPDGGGHILVKAGKPGVH